ncbi:NmrA/HSCARG family protein [Peribacillus muralis]|uniref:NmrA/HSCARG family protein n=1 Tax=Peribacillus muralis TaxID=264697 RepID=UPI00070EACA4|nr:NmrA/HSCARG family protein [Peribacillus muralis]
MPILSETILVIGATGKQGSAVVEKLLDDGWQVHAISRNLDRPVVQDLQQQGATVIKADLDDRQSLLDAMKSVYGIYVVQPIYGEEPEKELQQGKKVADVAKQVGIAHFVYSSAGGVDRNRGGAHFDIMWQIEQYIRAIDLPCTVLRPAFFMDNFKRLVQVQDQQLIIPEFVSEETKFQMISAKDIATFAAIAFNYPEKYKGKAIEIAGDEISLSQIKELFSQIFNVPCNILESPKGQFPGREWLEKEGYQADIPALRKIHPDLLNLQDWINTSGWNPLES